MNNNLKSTPIIFFDGVCNLCNHSVQFILKNDSQHFFRFASLQSAVASSMLKDKNISPEALDSIVYIYENKVYTESTAALQIAKHLDFPYQLLSVFMWVPSFIRDAVYRWIAKNRYKWFGRKEECWVPSEKVKKRFLE